MSAPAPAPALKPRQTSPEVGAPRVQNWRLRRTYRNQRQAGNGTAIGQALVWLIPWDAGNYPGATRGACTLLGKRWTKTALWRWSVGDSRAPPAVALALATEIERRCEVGRAIAASLRAYADAWRPFDRSNIGFLKIDPATGRNKRFRG
jgi:hypothetical protein